MRRVILTIVFLLLLIGIIDFSNNVLAGPPNNLKPSYAKVSIESPQSSSYNSSEVQLSFTILTNTFRQMVSNYSDSHCFIILDSKSYEFYGLSEVASNVITNDNDFIPYTELTLVGNTSIANLPTGSHSVEIEYGFYYSFPDKNYQIEYVILSSNTVVFSINSDISNDAQPTMILPTSYPYPSVSIPPLPTPKPTPTPNITLTPSVPEFPYLLGISLLLSTLAIALIVKTKILKHNKRNAFL